MGVMKLPMVSKVAGIASEGDGGGCAERYRERMDEGWGMIGSGVQ